MFRSWSPRVVSKLDVLFRVNLIQIAAEMSMAENEAIDSWHRRCINHKVLQAIVRVFPQRRARDEWIA